MKREILLLIPFAALLLLVFLTSILAVDRTPLGDAEAPASASSSLELRPDDSSASSDAALTFAVEKRYGILDKATSGVLSLTLEEYALGSLAAELPPTFHPEALKAQAVASRTYLAHLDHNNAEAEYHLSVNSKNWFGYVSESSFAARYGDQAEEYWQTLSQAVQDTDGEILHYGGAPALTVYHAISPGTTESASVMWVSELPYLVPVDSRWDKLVDGYESTATFSRTRVREILTSLGVKNLPSSPQNWFRNPVATESGTITEVTVGNMTLTGHEIRAAFSLRSSCFSIGYRGGVFIFTCRGYGHGVGLSQEGAEQMAKLGYSYREILAHYYPGTTLDDSGE